MAGVAEIEPNHNGSIMQPTDGIFPCTIFVLWKSIGQEAMATGKENDKANESSLSFQGLTPCRLCVVGLQITEQGIMVCYRSLILRGNWKVNANLHEKTTRTQT